MKINITNGFRVRAKNAHHLHRFLLRVRKSCEALKDQELPKLAARLASFSVDMASIKRNNERSPNDLVTNVFSYLQNQGLQAAQGSANTNTDWFFESVVIPETPPRFGIGRQSFLLLTFTRQEGLDDIFKSFKEVEDYSFVHDQDPPEGVTPKEWEARGKAWGAAMKDRIPQNNGFRFIITDENLLGMFENSKDEAVDKILVAMPDFEERLTSLANSVALTKKVKDLLAKPSGGIIVPGKKKDPREVQQRRGKAVAEALAWIESEPEEAKECKLRYAGRIEKEITREHLLDKINLVM